MIDNAPLLALATPQIDREESCRLSAYLDTKGIPTIGWGRADSGVHLGMTCSQADADAWRDGHLNRVCAELDDQIPWWRDLSLPRQAVLLEMAYQLGTGHSDPGANGLMAFQHTLAAVRAGDWGAARAGMLNSKWARVDSPNRARREADQMFTGEIA